MVSHLGAMISVVNGSLIGRRYKQESGVVGATSIGDGATSTGAFHEALNQAAVEKLPLVLVVANNQYAYSTPDSRQFACRSLLDKAAGYGVAAHSVDGTDLVACLSVLGQAIANARNGEGPQFVLARLLRLCGHGEHDDASYIDPKLKQAAIGRDCLRLAEERLLSQHWADAGQIEAWRADAIRHVDDVVALVQREPTPDPYQENWCALACRHLSEIHDRPKAAAVDPLDPAPI